jgi:hypothetical protein
MKSDFKLVGLSKTKSMTCEPLDKEELFWPKCGLSQDRFDALWKYKEGNWGEGTMIAEIEYDSLTEDGIPVNGIVIAVREP